MGILKKIFCFSSSALKDKFFEDLNPAELGELNDAELAALEADMNADNLFLASIVADAEMETPRKLEVVAADGERLIPDSLVNTVNRRMNEVTSQVRSFRQKDFMRIRLADEETGRIMEDVVFLPGETPTVLVAE